MIKSIIILSAFSLGSLAALFYLEHVDYKNDMAYVDMCETMGGQAVLGLRGTNQCLNAAGLIGAE